MQNQNFLPNTTQIPNTVLDELMPNLKDVELRVLLIVVRQTLGWIEDLETGRRKEKDWISRSQLMSKTGRKQRAISSAVDMLCKEGVILAYNHQNVILDTGIKRRLNFGKIFYRFNHKYGENMLFGSLKQKKHRVQILRTQKGATTKLTQGTTKDNNNKYLKKEKRQQNREQLQKMKAIAFNKT